LPDSGFGYANLAGVGVAFKLVWAIGQELSESHRVSEEFKDLLMEALSLVAVGTIADVVPLVDENRVLTHYGLQSLTAASRPGLRALIAASRVRGSSVSARDVAFRLAPRLNAAGRMGDARAAVELLTTSDERHAADLAEHLERQNRLRIKAQAATLEEAEDKLKQDEQLLQRNCIVLADPDWHQGVLGLVASRLAERHWRPAFVFGTNGDLACGSARSVPGFPLFSIVKECADLLERFGGHKGAAGLTLRVEQLPAFTERVNELAKRFFGLERPVPELALDGEIELAALNPALVKEVRLLEPFGKGNPQPVFVASGLRHVGNAHIVGATKNHLAFLVRQGRTTLRVIAMNKADWLDELRARQGETFSLAFEPRIDTYRGRMAVELRAEDLQWDAERVLERRSA
ncbi:MAG: single-stranded-DNA-specific exonuclease RecJ, partial [Planctomycetota bacterium]